MIGARKDQTFLLSLEVHNGLDSFLAWARMNGLKLYQVNNGWDNGSLEVGCLEEQVKI